MQATGQPIISGVIPNNESVRAQTGVAAGQLFGTQIGGIPVRIQESWKAEFFADTEVFPVPSGTQRLVGVFQLRGEVVPVFDPTLDLKGNAKRKRKLGVMVVHHKGETLGISVAAEPAPIHLGESAYVQVPNIQFGPALSEARVGSVISSDTAEAMRRSVWWDLSLDTFFQSITKQ
jgi:hypothetical protein